MNKVQILWRNTANVMIMVTATLGFVISEFHPYYGLGWIFTFICCGVYDMYLETNKYV